MFQTRMPDTVVAQLSHATTIPARELAVLESLTTPVHVPEGRLLMRQGAPGSEALFIVTGEVLVERDGKPVTVLGPGEIVGEGALLANQPRNATVTAASDVLLVAMTRREFATVLDRCPVLTRRILRAAVGRAGSHLQ